MFRVAPKKNSPNSGLYILICLGSYSVLTHFSLSLTSAVERKTGFLLVNLTFKKHMKQKERFNIIISKLRDIVFVYAWSSQTMPLKVDICRMLKYMNKTSLRGYTL